MAMDGMKCNYKAIFALAIVAGIVFGAAAGYVTANYAMQKGPEEITKEFYSTEQLVSVSPSDYISDLKKGKSDGLAVDLRSASAYQSGHLVTSINIPAGGMTPTQLLGEFQKLPQDRPIIAYCYSSYCMLSRNVGKYLADNGIYVKHFTAGAYEIMRDYPDYVVNGTEPGALETNATYNPNACEPTVSNGFSC
ncbi:MAG: rhodanese-like domain-containing protein [Candidatus Micrarchaeia archaeon]